MSLAQAASKARTRLASAKESAPPHYWEWYPYDSLANFAHLDALFTSAGVDPGSILFNGPLLDIGAADGDLAFALEAMGAVVTVVDHPRSNHNGMAGLRWLHEALQSKVDVVETDIDRRLELDGQQYTCALLLGLLYHLQNPMLVLDTVARHAKYSVVSTRIARFFPGVRQDLVEVPAAYLLSEDELNQDNSNFWIFTEAGFRRVLARTHWRVLALHRVGDTANSTADSLDRDERAFCLLQSEYGLRHLRLLQGWHQPEDTGWRWTESRFSLAFDAGLARTLSVQLFIPDALIARWGSVMLSCRANDAELEPACYNQPGLYTFNRSLPRREGTLELIFQVDHALPPDLSDPRERCLIVAEAKVE